MRWSKIQINLGLAVLLALLTLCCAALQDRSPSPEPMPVPAASPKGATSTKPTQPEPFVMIDPSHGGEDKGVIFTSRIMEKDVTLTLARGLRKELQERGIDARLLREGDTTLSLEHRAEISNQQRPALYVALHAGEPGSGIRVYSALLPAHQPNAGNFVSWDSAQAASLERSLYIAKTIAAELKRKEVRSSNLQAFLRPLNNVLAPAIAVEFAVNRNDARSLDSMKAQSSTVSALASAIAQSRMHWGAHK
jgi:N-acetylmuramoyl-L-alanine amidase